MLVSTVLFFASAGCVCTEIPASAYAAQAMPLTECTTLPEWRVSFSAADHPAKLRSRHAGDKITGRGKIIYDFLASEIKNVPFGSKEEHHYALGQFMERELITDTQLRVIYDSLLANLPYELYWYDKSAEDSFIVSLDGAQTRSPGNKNPWQLVYVFDADSSTNTVCEGYAKAFQYLCDLTAFEDEDIYSYIVTGTVSELTGQGLYMWNIVHMGANGNYLVDVTNCDQGMIGENNQLFLAGYTQGNITNGYRFEVSSRQISYQYLESGPGTSGQHTGGQKSRWKHYCIFAGK